MEQPQTTESLFSYLVTSFRRFGDRPALFVDDKTYSYGDLEEHARRISDCISNACSEQDEFVSIYAHRSLTAYAGILGTLAAQKAYTPLHPDFPIDRTAVMFNRSGSRTIVVGRESVDLLPELFAKTDQALTLIGPEIDDWGDLPLDYPAHKFVGQRDLPEGGDARFSPADPSSSAYLLFTSGSTGEPKGIRICHKNVTSYVDYILNRYEVTEDDRISNSFDLTFDPSVHDMFVAWAAGACLYVVPESILFAPSRFIKKHELTMWCSVPSTANMMARLRMLKPGAFPSLRCSLFCGEALSARSAAMWQDAAPNSIVENLYGPTEATITIIGYRWDRNDSEEECINGMVPIGKPFPNHLAEVINTYGQIASVDEEGELCLCGPQVSDGYFNDARKTNECFVTLPDVNGGRWYKTGDLAKKDENGVIHYLGRLDNQVQVRGHRVELQEVEYAISRLLDTGSAICIPWPIVDGVASNIHAFVTDKPASVSVEDILHHCSATLPDYMVPETIHLIDEYPLNPNGKIDRRALASLLS
jgi:amino acid adenylation domain-containing protein